MTLLLIPSNSNPVRSWAWLTLSAIIFASIVALAQSTITITLPKASLRSEITLPTSILALFWITVVLFAAVVAAPSEKFHSIFRSVSWCEISSRTSLSVDSVGILGTKRLNQGRINFAFMWLNFSSSTLFEAGTEWGQLFAVFVAATHCVAVDDAVNWGQDPLSPIKMLWMLFTANLFWLDTNSCCLVSILSLLLFEGYGFTASGGNPNKSNTRSTNFLAVYFRSSLFAAASSTVIYFYCHLHDQYCYWYHSHCAASAAWPC